MRGMVVEMLQPIGAFAVENLACDGTPDVCTVAGWLELKVGMWPMRAGSRVCVDVRIAQGLWMRRWIRHGGRVWTLTLIDQSHISHPRNDTAWLLHSAEWAHEHLGNVDEETLKGNAIAWWKKPDGEQLISAMLRGLRQ